MIGTAYPPAPVQASGTSIQPTAVCTPESQLEPRLSKFSAEPVSQKTALMKSRRRLQRISAGISLIILSLGFSLLGLLSLANKPHADLANVPCAVTASWTAGSASSLLVGTHSWSLPVFIGDGTPERLTRAQPKRLPSKPRIPGVHEKSAVKLRGF
jgi:hypothetical protein